MGRLRHVCDLGAGLQLMLIPVDYCLFIMFICLVIHPTLGTDDRKDPISVTVVSTVVTTKAVRAGTASLETQKLNQERATIRTVGA